MKQETDLYRGMLLVRSILRMDPRCPDYVDDSPRGFWASLRLGAMVFPVYLIQMLAGQTQDPAATNSEPVFWLAFQALLYALGWLVFPVIMDPVTRILGCHDRWQRYIIGFNWLHLPLAAVLLPIVLLSTVGETPMQALALPVLMAAVAFMGYHGLVARRMLGVDTTTAVGLVILELLVSLMVNNGIPTALGY
ncbi:hypothetical protein HEQ60_06725 [Haematospirillum sp. H1815]|uniref:hypothetical protein n=1 Tax=Haematospirillum sp. H1815 TaxID=2723108 RepID=UPI0014388E4F|nr:hypothetical protein [Haematospirillum sp. H1815]NKD77453.1 hypothetical protein [Haematospirillum sp. H1815]